MMFIFDVDGTLTPSRKEIDNVFKWWFLRKHPKIIVL